MTAKHALYLGLIIIGAAFLLIDATVLGFIFEAAGLVLLLISALMEWAGEHQDPHPYRHPCFFVGVGVLDDPLVCTS